MSGHSKFANIKHKKEKNTVGRKWRVITSAKEKRKCRKIITSGTVGQGAIFGTIATCTG